MRFSVLLVCGRGKELMAYLGYFLLEVVKTLMNEGVQIGALFQAVVLYSSDAVPFTLI